VPTLFTRRAILQSSAALGVPAAVQAASGLGRFSFWVFGLLRPSRLIIEPAGSSRLHLRGPDGERIIEPGRTQLIDANSVPLSVTGPDDTPVHFFLEVPGLLRRLYCGGLHVDWRNGQLVPVISMQPELAVNSIVGAELPLLRSSANALTAQSVVVRSFLAGITAPRHANAFFCDTTHCQFLRSPAPPDGDIARAVDRTRGVVLTIAGTILPASYSAACGGVTEKGERDGFAYQSVRCAVCRERHLSRRGHGWGLCQEGAMGLASRGEHWRTILSEYFPSASLSQA
jgi:hypothetical protein